MTTKPTRLLLLSLIVVAAASCSPTAPVADPLPQEATPTGAEAQPSPAEPTAATTAPAPASATVPDETMMPPATQPDLSGLPQVAQAKADLALRLGVLAADLEVIAVEPKTWGDTSMGCPQPNMSYLQVPQDGLLVQLRHGDQVYAYHSGGNLPPFLCEQPLTDEKTTPVFGEDVLTPRVP